MPHYFDLKVALLGVEPRVWRRFMSTPEATLENLHLAIQGACGWENRHLLEFRDASGVGDDLAEPFTRGRRVIARSLYGRADDEEDVPIADDIEVSSVFTGETKKCFYVYDFGDYWEHLIELKDMVELPETFVRRLTGGSRAFPPEDCGGTQGYERCCEALRMSEGEVLKLDPYAREEMESIRTWLGDWDPEGFDLAGVRAEFDL